MRTFDPTVQESAKEVLRILQTSKVTTDQLKEAATRYGLPLNRVNKLTIKSLQHTCQYRGSCRLLTLSLQPTPAAHHTLTTTLPLYTEPFLHSFTTANTSNAQKPFLLSAYIHITTSFPPTCYPSSTQRSQHYYGATYHIAPTQHLQVLPSSHLPLPQRGSKWLISNWMPPSIGPSSPKIQAQSRGLAIHQAPGAFLLPTWPHTRCSFASFAGDSRQSENHTFLLPQNITP